jgi:hypothetical protein
MNTEKLTFTSISKKDECHVNFNKWYWELEDKSRVPVAIARESWVEATIRSEKKYEQKFKYVKRKLVEIKQCAGGWASQLANDAIKKLGE